jgi:UDP-glucose 4-epimerase
MLVHGYAKPVKPRRVVIMGARGFVGNAIATRLERHKVPVLRLSHHDIDLLVPGAVESLVARLETGDAFVAVSALAPCRNARMLRDNVTMALAMVDAAAQVSLAHIVNISSDGVYADGPVPLTEDSPAAPTSLHGAMHLARELMFTTSVKAPLAILRPSLLYGAGDPHNGYGPNRFRRLAAKGEPIVLFGDGEERRDHVLVDDVAELATRVLNRRSTGTLNVATGTVTSFREIAEMVVKIAGKPVTIRGTPRSGPMPHNGYRPFDVAACKTAFPDFTYMPLAAGLAKAWTEEARQGR